MHVSKESFPSSIEKIDINSINKSDRKNNCQTGIIQYKLDSNNELIFTGFNSFCSSILGVDCNKFMGKSITDAFPSLKGTEIVENYKNVALTGESWETEFVEYFDDIVGGTYKVNVHQIEPSKILVLFKDITHQKKIEKQKEDNLTFLNSIYNGVQHLIFVVNVLEKRNYRFSKVNPAFEKVSGLKSEDIAGKSPNDFQNLISKESIDTIISKYNECSELKKSLHYEELIQFEGIDRWWLTTLNPILDINGNVVKIIGTSIEITDRKNIEQKLIDHEANLELSIDKRTSELKESELRFRKMAEGLYDGIRIYDGGNLVYVNNTFCQISGYDERELKNMSSLNLVHGEDREKVTKHIEESKKSTKTPDDILFNLVRKDGTIRRIRNRYIIFEKENGETILYIISNDITDKEQYQQQLLLQSTALNAAANGISISDSSGKIIWVNNAFTTLTGYSREELIGKFPNILKSGRHSKKYYEEMWETVNKGSVWRGEFINKRKNGELYYDETTITPLTTNDSITNFIEIKQDISNRKQFEADLKSSEEYYRSLFENSHNSILVSDFNGNILEMNYSAKQLFGLNGEKLSELNSSEFIFNEITLAEFLAKLRKEGFVKDFPTQIKKKNNQKIDCLINATLHQSTNGGSEIFQAILIDISDIVKARNLLENALKESEKANKLKSEFLATMSHEIRTPINIILSYLGLIKSDIISLVDEDLQGLFPSMEKAGNRIIRTIDLLLNVAELNTGTYEAKFKQVDLYDKILENVYLDYRKEAHSKGLQFNILNLSNNPIVNIDEYTVTETFKNLIDNAIKYTPNGKIDIILDQNSTGNLVVKLNDTGIGIDQSYLPNLFEPFTQEETGYSRKFEGNGLGMALVKNYLKLNKATIEVDSTKGIGTNFTITFNK